MKSCEQSLPVDVSPIAPIPLRWPVSAQPADADATSTCPTGRSRREKSRFKIVAGECELDRRTGRCCVPDGFLFQRAHPTSIPAGIELREHCRQPLYAAMIQPTTSTRTESHRFPVSRNASNNPSPKVRIQGPPKITLSPIPLSRTNAAISSDSAPGWNHTARGPAVVGWEDGCGKRDLRMGSPMAGLMMIEVAVDARSGRMSCEASDKGEPKVKGGKGGAYWVGKDGEGLGGVGGRGGGADRSDREVVRLVPTPPP